MYKHKPWDWSRNRDDFWHVLSEDSKYLINHWKEKGFVNFRNLGCGIGRHSFQFAAAKNRTADSI